MAPRRRLGQRTRGTRPASSWGDDGAGPATPNALPKPHGDTQWEPLLRTRSPAAGRTQPVGRRLAAWTREGTAKRGSLMFSL